MNDDNKKLEDIHITKGFTGWVHHHRKMAKWLFKLLIAAVTSTLFYLKRQEKVIEQEEKK